jgi:hypothetical protein
MQPYTWRVGYPSCIQHPLVPPNSNVSVADMLVVTQCCSVIYFIRLADIRMSASWRMSPSSMRHPHDGYMNMCSQHAHWQLSAEYLDRPFQSFDASHISVRHRDDMHFTRLLRCPSPGLFMARIEGERIQCCLHMHDYVCIDCNINLTGSLYKYMSSKSMLSLCA